MLLRASKYYLGVWIPTAASWVLVVLVAALFADVAVGIGLAWALGGSLAAILFAAYSSRADKKSSSGFIASHSKLDDSELLRRGLKKGLIIGPVSVLGVALAAGAPILVDRILTALGK
jgi:hypothetical protein